MGKSASAGTQPETSSAARSWASAIVVILSGIASMGAILKVSPALTLLAASGIIADAGEGGWLITICSIVGLVLAIPGGSLVDKVGAKRIALIGLLAGSIGSLAGALATDFAFLMCTRLLEGVSVGFVNVAGLSLISELFTPAKRGLPMSIWACYAGLASVFIYNMASLLVNLEDPSSWTNVWVFAGAFELVTFALFALVVKVPKQQGEAAADMGDDKPSASVAEGLRSVPSWLLCVMIVTFTFGLNSILTFMPSYCNEQLGIDYAVANSYSSMFSVAMIVAAFVMGFVLDKVPTMKGRTLMLIILSAATMAVFAVCFGFTAALAVPCLLVSGIVIQAYQSAALTVAPDTATNPFTVGITMGIVTIAMNLGGFGPTVVGSLISGDGYGAVTAVLVAVGAVGLVAAVLLRAAMLKKVAAKRS